MNEKRTENIKQENKKALLPFILIVMLSTIAGGFVGFFSSRYDENLRDLLLNGGLFLIEAIAPYGMIVADIIFIPAAIIIFIQCKNQLKNGGMNQDEVLDEVDYRLSYPLILTSACMIVDFFFFPVAIIYSSDQVQFSLLFVIIFVISIAIITVIQQKVIDLEKQINPEKQGSVYDMKFAKKWEESCDEAQRLNIYKSAYISYKITTKAFVAIWVVLVLGMFLFESGILPLATVSILWLIQTITYGVSAMRLEKKK